MKKMIFSLFFLVITAACISIPAYHNMKFFILGRWHTEYEQVDGNKKYQMQYKLLFLPFNILLMDVVSPYEQYHNIRFSYRFADKDRIIIEGRFTSELIISKDDDDLIIQSDNGFIPNGKYMKISSFWTWLPVVVSIIIISIVIQVRKRKLSKNVKMDQNF